MIKMVWDFSLSLKFQRKQRVFLPTPEPGLPARPEAVHLTPLKVPGTKTGLEKAKIAASLVGGRSLEAEY